MPISAETSFALAPRRKDDNSQPLHSVLLPRKRINANIYTLSDEDHGYVLVFLATCTVTVPSGLSSGFGCAIIAWSAGDVTFSASGVNITSRSSFTKTAGQGALMYIMSVESDNFLLSGDGV